MRRYIAELLGTFAIVFFGTGAIIVNQEYNAVVSHAGMAITAGFIVMCMIYAFGNISGAHFNPAVTLAFFLAKRFEAKQLLPYFIAQFAGALAASMALRLLFPYNTSLGITQPSGSELQSFVLECILSFFLILVILSVAQGSKEQGMFAGLAIGAVVLLEAMFAGPVSGASMNPARSLAPAVVSLHTEHVWIYLVAPLLGTSLSVPVWKYLVAKS